MAQQGVSQTGGGYTQARPASSSSSGAKTAPKQTQPGPKSSSGHRFIRTPAGAARYKKPIGTEIVATPRDQRGATAQRDKESTDRYKGLISGDAETQRKAMAGLNSDQLKRLSEVAFSFSSNDPAVARLRAGIALEMKARGLDVNRYGGLAGRGSSGGGSASGGGGSVTAINWATGERYQVPTKASAASRKSSSATAADERRALAEAVAQERIRRAAITKAERERVAAAKKLEAAQKAAAKAEQARQARLERARVVNQRRPSNGADARVVRLSALDLANVSTQQRQDAEDKGQALPGGRFPIRNVTDLRAAIQAFGRADPQDREKIARFICKRAKALNAEHMLGSGIRSAAGYNEDTELANRPDPVVVNLAEGPQVVDLAGHWKHGWIPLDGTAVAAKTHGRQGAKPWWDGGAKGHHGGSSGGGGSKKTAEKLTAKQRYERSAPDVIKHPRGGGVEYRKRDDGRYVEYRNGKKAKHAGEDVTHSRQDLARTFRSGGRRGAPSVEARAVEARNQRQLKIERGPSKGSGQNVRATKAAQRLREGQTALPAQRFKPKPGSSGPTKTAPSGPDRVPSGSTGIEWRREPDGTYTRYKNGKKSKALIDQGYSLERVRQLEATRGKA